MWCSRNILVFLIIVVTVYQNVKGQGQIQVNRGPGLTPKQIEDLEASYAQTVRRKRVLNLNGINEQRITRQDVQNDQLLGYSDYVTLGTVNFNQIIPGIMRGDVLDYEIGTAHRTPATTPASHRRVKRKAINTEYNVVERWDDATLHYTVLESDFSVSQLAALRTKITSSLAPIQQNSCIRFVEVLPTEIFPASSSLVEVSDTMSACASVIGRIPNQHQVMQLASGCHVTGTIQHEFLHALGFGHEHERPDRDQYIAVNSKYILQNYIRNFDKEPHPTYYSNISYDLSSIMHYSLAQFSIDAQSHTLELVNPYLAISALDVGQRIGFSWLDEVALNSFYFCEADCPTESCRNGGYLRKSTTGVCQCICPPGLGGPTCEAVVNPCGEYVDLSQHGGEKIITSRDFDGSTARGSNDVCHFYIKGPGYLSLTFNHFHVVCDNYLEIRAFHISQPSMGLCGDTEPSPVKTLHSPEPGTLMLIYDTTMSTSASRGWSLTARSHTDACGADPCHGAKCIPEPGSDVQYTCVFPDHAMHCLFEEGVLGACNRVRFNQYYQDQNEFQMAWQVSSTNNPRMLTSTDITERPQRGVATIIPHNFTGRQWCFSFKYQMVGTEQGTLNVHVIRNGQMNAQSIRFTDTDDQKSFKATELIDIDGRGFADSDMVEIAFETMYTTRSSSENTIEIHEIHLIPEACPLVNHVCRTLPCQDKECKTTASGVLSCEYPDDDIYCGFEESENGCQGDLEYFGNLDKRDSADWTPNSGPTLTPNTGPDGALLGSGYLYMESNFPPNPRVSSPVRSAYIRLAPRVAANRCLSFWYHMFGSEVLRLDVQLYIYDTFQPQVAHQLRIEGNQGNEWKFAQVNINSFNRRPDVKLQVVIIGVGRNKFADIAIDDLSMVKGSCDSSAVNGVWQDWSEWSDCSVSCGTGTRSHSRSCTPPRNGGQDCSGNSTETEQCTTVCGVDGVLSQWGDWSDCSVTCTGGTQTRTRTCTAPLGGGQPCSGVLEMSQECGTAFCPLDGSWNEWSSWGDCSVSATAQCGTTGERRRERTCRPPQHGGQNCQGDNIMTTSCGTAACEPIDSTVSPWQEWGSCTRTCGTGQRSRKRLCISLGLFGGITCITRGLEETVDCNTNPCAIDATVGEWAAWSGCSVSCGEGIKSRTRPCVTEQQHGGQSCAAKGISEEMECTEALCVMDASLSDWEEWGQCTVSCGGGTHTRSRQCLTQPQNGGKTCTELGGMSDSEACADNICPVDGVLSEWTEWSVCDATCGDGKQARTRECSLAVHGGVSCLTEVLSESQACFVEPGCVVDGVLSVWTDWSQCTQICGGGEKLRTRTCTPPQNGGQDCDGSVLSQDVSCNSNPCPVDGQLSEWTSWDICSKSCGSGTETRSRECTPAQHGGTPCDGETTDSRECNTEACPVDGVWKTWSSWVCDVTCGSGTTTRSRECDGPFHGGQDCEGFGIETKQCSAPVLNCPIDAVNNAWGQWSVCSASCGTGTRARTRTCVPAQFGGVVCGPSSQTEDCLIRACSRDGVPRPWSQWSQCSVSCETGTHKRTRTCTTPFNGGSPCNVPLEETESCQGLLITCDKTYNEWQSWSQCSASCGQTGERSRRRTCTGRALCDGVDDVQSEACNRNIVCPVQSVDGFYSVWSQWGSCSVSCGNGSQIRSRSCTPPVGTGRPCSVLGTPTETQNCDMDCKVDGIWQSWQEWGACSVSCGSGNRLRSRECTTPTNGGKSCEGNRQESSQCNSGVTCAPTDGFLPWGDWSSCSPSTCPSTGTSFQFRRRACISRCNTGRRFEFLSCDPCSTATTPTTTQAVTTSSTTTQRIGGGGTVAGIWGQWAQWTTCVVSCQGQRTRLRSCNAIRNLPGTVTCPGDSLQTGNCSDDSSCDGSGNPLVSGNKATMCESFDGSSRITQIGQSTPSGNDFRIQSGPSSNYFTGSNGRIGQTGPNWAVDGVNYLLMTSNAAGSRKEFRFNTLFEFNAGACIRFMYSTHGSQWSANTRLELVLVSDGSNRHSMPFLSRRTPSNPLWQSAQITIPPQQVLFDKARVALTVIGGGGRSGDLGIDDFQMIEGSCPSNTVICPKPDPPTSLTCGFESGQDCSWIGRSVEGNSDVWQVWRGRTPASGTGPNSASQGQNYLYLEADRGEFGLSKLRAGQGCLTFSYHMKAARNRIGTLTIRSAATQQILFTMSRNRGSRWRRQRLTLNIPATSSSSANPHQIIVSYTSSGRNAKEDVAIDNLRYRAGSPCR